MFLCEGTDDCISPDGAACARTMVRFAACMINDLKNFNYDKFQLAEKPNFELRIGGIWEKLRQSKAMRPFQG